MGYEFFRFLKHGTHGGYSGADFMNGSRVAGKFIDGSSNFEIYGGETSGDDLLLYGNHVDAYPFIRLNGGNNTQFKQTTGSWEFQYGANNSFSIAPAAGETNIYGRNTAAKILIINANQIDTCYIKLDPSNDIELIPSAGNYVKFGAYTVGAAAGSAGYVTIRDAGGTLRKLMVQP